MAGHLASALFAAGLLGAALLAAAILPLSTAYSVSEATGHEASLDDSFQEARFFYVTYGLVVALGAAIVLVPGIPLIGVLIFTQVVNAVLLLPLLVVMIRIARDREVMGDYRNGPVGQTLAYAARRSSGFRWWPSRLPAFFDEREAAPPRFGSRASSLPSSPGGHRLTCWCS